MFLITQIIQITLIRVYHSIHMNSIPKLLLAAVLSLAAFSVAAQIDNDDCSGAVLLDPNTDCDFDLAPMGTTVGASASGIGSCFPDANDAWYSFVATATAHSLQVFDVYTPNIPGHQDFFLEVFSGACGGLQLQHQYCVEMYYGIENIRIGDLAPGNTYYIRVGNPAQRPIYFRICMGNLVNSPANDACADAIALAVSADETCASTETGTTANASNSPLPPCNNCFPNEDVWYTFKATAVNHVVTLSEVTDIFNQQLYRVFVSAYSGVCGALVYSGREAQVIGQGTLYLNKLNIGQTYYLRVFADFNNPSYPVNFKICVNTPPPPANDNCTDAQTVAAEADYYNYTATPGSLNGATPSGTGCEGTVASDVWYQFTATSPTHRIMVNANAAFGAEMFGGDCSSLQSLVCKTGNLLALTATNLSVGATYYYRVYNSSPTELLFNTYVLTLPPPPVNDDCANAEPLVSNPDANTCDALTEGNTLGATSSQKDCGGVDDTHDVWYSFVAGSVSHLLAVTETNTLLGSYEHFGYEVYGGDCGNLSSLVCRQYPLDSYDPIFLGSLVPGATYYLRIFSKFGDNHTFSICLQTLPPPPPNMDCAQALQLVSTPVPDCSLAVAGNTAGVAVETAATCYYQSGNSLWYSFTAINSTHVVEINDVQQYYFSSVGYWVELYEGDDCGNLGYVGCFINDSKFFLNNLVPGKTYYLQWISGLASRHAFNLCLSHFPKPQNDDCADAQMLYSTSEPFCNNGTPGTTAGSTPAQATACFDRSDVWFSVIPSQTTLRIQVNNAVSIENGNGTSLMAELLTGDCGNLQSVYCWPGAILYSSLLYVGDLAPGQQYFLRFASPDNSPVSFNVCLLTPPLPPDNDNCATPAVLVPEPGSACTTVTGNTSLASPSPKLPWASCCKPGGDLWYAFTATQANHSIFLTNIRDASNNSLQTAVLELYDASCPAANSFMGKYSVYYGNTLWLTNLSTGHTYYLRIYAQENLDISFELCITAPAPPVNDECAGALPLPVNEALDCSTLLQTSTAGATQSQPGCGAGAANDIWYVFTAKTEAYRFKFDYAYSVPNSVAGYEIFSGDCGQLLSMACGQLAPYPDPVLMHGFVPGNNYYLRLYGGLNAVIDWYVCTVAIDGPLANDACAGAVVLPVSPDVACTMPVEGTTLGAGTSQPNCNGELSNDVWYSFTAASPSQLLRIDLDRTYFYGNQFIGCQVFSGDCNQLLPLLCLPYVYKVEHVLRDLAPGQTYHIQIFSYGFDAHDFSVCLSDLPEPANDACTKAIPVLPNPDLICNTFYSGTTAGAAYQPNTGDQGVWYTFTAAQGTHFIQLQNVQTVFGSSNYLYYRLYHGADCDNLFFMGNFQAGSDGRLDNLQPGETYLIQVLSLHANAGYTFDLCIKSIPSGLLNIDCASAIQVVPNNGLECDIVTHVSTAGAPLTLGMDPECGINWFFWVSESWYSFVATSPNHQIELSNVSTLYGSGGLYVKIYESDACLNLTRIYCLSGQKFIVFNNLIPGLTYSIQVLSDAGSAHEFDLCIKTKPIPVNDLCENAATLPVSPGSNCDAYTAGTTISAGGDVWYAFTATQTAHTLWAGPDAVQVGVFEADCINLQNLAYHEITDSFIIGDLVVGKQYLVQVLGNDIDFNICVSTPPMPPANDACAGAIELPVSPDGNCQSRTSGTTENATISTDPYLFIGAGVPAYDVWYSFVASQENHLIHIDNVANPSSLLVLDVYSGICGNFALVGFIPLYNGPTMLLTNLMPGERYFVRVYDNNGHPTTFDLCVTSIPKPANDECSAAIPLPINPVLNCDATTTASSLGATQSHPGCSGEKANDIWFQFIPDSKSVHLEIESQWAAFGAEILEGDCNAPTVFLPCAENASTLDIHGLTPGNSYYLRLFTFANQSSEFTICLSALPEPPSNDLCTGAELILPNNGLDCGLLYPGTTLGATSDLLSCNGYGSNDVWYQFVATSNTHLLRLRPTAFLQNGTGDNLGMQVFEGDDCDNYSPLFCHEGSNSSLMVLESLAIGNRYFVRVFSVQGAAHNFTLCLATAPPTPANTECSGAVAIVPSPDMQCTAPVTGTFAGVTGDFYLGCNTGTSLWYRFTATSNDHYIRLQDTMQRYGDPFLTLELYTGDCGSLQSVACTSYKLGLYVYYLSPGQEYYIRVAGGHQAGTQFDLCVLTVVEPANGSCYNAQLLAVSPSGHCVANVSGTTLGAQVANTACDYGPSVFYSFVATSTDHLIGIRDRESVSYNNRFYLEVLEGPCNNFHRIYACEYPFSPPVLRNLTPGKTYIIQLTAHSPGYLNFGICIATAQPSLVLNSIYPESDGCRPGNNERVTVNFSNWGNGHLPDNFAQFTLTVSGANNGVYGPVFNPQFLDYFSYPYFYPPNGTLDFTGVDLSNPGMSHLTVTATYPYDDFPDRSLSVDFAGTQTVQTYYPDADGDGFGDPLKPFDYCYQKAGYVLDKQDCDDENNLANPGMVEVCNGFDDDCNGLADAADPGLTENPPLGIICPDNITLLTDPGACTAQVQYLVNTADNCGFQLEQTEGLASEALFPFGTTLNAFTVRDPAGNTATCSFSIEVQKAADPSLAYAYAVIGFNDVYMKTNTVESGGVGLVDAGKQARLQMGSTVTAPNTFVNAPVIDLQSGSAVATSYFGQVDAASLPAFKANSTPTSNNISIPNNSAPVILTGSSYGNVIIGINATVTFSGASTVMIKELTLKDGATVLFDQNTEVLVNKGITIAKNVVFNPGDNRKVQCFAGLNITVDRGCNIAANMYTQKDLRLEKAAEAAPTRMTGLFIATNVYSREFVVWNWDPGDCPQNKPSTAQDRVAETDLYGADGLGALRVFPNPASEYAQIGFEIKAPGSVLIQLSDASGRVAHRSKFAAEAGENRCQLTLGSLPEGIYTVQVAAPGQLMTARLVVLRP